MKSIFIPLSDVQDFYPQGIFRPLLIHRVRSHARAKHASDVRFVFIKCSHDEC